MRSALYFVLLLLSVQTFAAPKETITYFACEVKESSKQVVTVKFAIKNLNTFKGTGELLNYPGANEEFGAISVTPEEVNGRYPMMSNLNGQGGDLRIEGNNLRLWGDGDGYQFTDLVVWDPDSGEDSDVFEGYVRDYGPAYGDSKTFKQFITCKRSTGKAL